jgi:hypothetical protein
MVSGKPRAPRPKALALGLAAAVLAAALIAAAIVVGGPAVEKLRAAAFAQALSSIDSLIVSRAESGIDAKKAEAAFARALSKARTEGDWLSLLKRSKASQGAGDSGRYVKVAERAIAALPKSEALAAGAAHAYLRGGEAPKALALFDKVIFPDARPELWAEAFMRSAAEVKAGEGAAKASVKAADYARLADALGDPRPFLGAAALSLASSDKLAAASWLKKAVAAGLRPSSELMWDAGLYEELSRRSDSGAKARDLALMGDASWLTGDGELARKRWERAIALEPRLSWKSYAKLGLVSSGELSVSYWSRLRSAFLSGPASAKRDEALEAYAAYLAREGREGEALAALKGESSLALLELSIRGLSMPEGRLASELERLAASRADDPRVMGATLRSLSLRGMYGEAAVLEETAMRRNLESEYLWYYEAETLAARGAYADAAKLISGQEEPGCEGYFALGSLYEAMGDTAAAAKAYARSAAASSGSRNACAALKALGRELGASRDGEGASRAYKAALSADPLDAEAAMLARQEWRLPN